MALSFEKTIDLTSYAKNPAPSHVRSLSIVHEASDGELVQYYINEQTSTEEDKRSHAIGVYDKESKQWNYHDYDSLEWEVPRQRIAGNRIERLGVKAFPDVGAIAFYKLAYRDVSRIAAPVNVKSGKSEAPMLEGQSSEDGSITFRITQPESIEYKCYRIVMQDGAFSEDYITYDLELTVSAPKISGSYECFAIGYPEGGAYCSKDSNTVVIAVTGKQESFEEPFYSKETITELKARIEGTYTKAEVDAIIQSVLDRTEDGSEVKY